MLLIEQKGIYAVLKNNLSAGRVRVTPPSSARTKGDTRYLFDFPFDEIYVRLLFFTLGRSFYA